MESNTYKALAMSDTGEENSLHSFLLPPLTKHSRSDPDETLENQV